jgi:hypothetical protein
VGIALIGGAGEGPCSHRPAAACVEAAPCGWWYAATIPHGSKVVVFFTDGDLLPRGKPKLAAFLFDRLSRSPLTRTGRDFVEERLGRCQWRKRNKKVSVHPCPEHL